MSLVCREQSQETLQRSSPAPTSATTPDGTTTTTTATDYDETEPACDKTDGWIKPPLKTPTPSFQDDGLERTDQYVFQYMAPLGHLPPARLIREIRAQELECFIGQDRRKQSTSRLVSRPASSTIDDELGSSVRGLQQQSTVASLRIRANGSSLSKDRRKRSSRSTNPDQNQRAHHLRDRNRRAISGREHVSMKRWQSR
ncbi:hypothetical protein AOQ84DRAFT_228903 [Glonium stellatum]|uniref:Uncharacterized protein n=1 Tax=Glonium stellatum TaxID=574774 RepID=A0A8E2FD05_9PEZI|nr:hypothetical protein AOQ84DRAFT_228903 [Glonium stellatum]